MKQNMPARPENLRELSHPDDIASAAGLLAQHGQVNEALALLSQGLGKHPEHCLLLHNLAELYRQTRQEEKAEVLFIAVITRYPRFIPAYQSLTALLKARLGTMQIASPQRVAIVEQLAILTNNMGNALLEAGQIEAARAAYLEASQLFPNYPSALSNLSNVLRQMGEVTEAEALARRAVALRPEFAEALNNLGSTLSEQGRMEEAARCYAEALRIKPEMEEARHNAGSGSLFMQLYRDDLPTAKIVQAHRAWGKAYPAPAQAVPTPAVDGRRRIGFISGDFREHAMMQFVIPVLQKLDRGRFEIICYANQTAEDGITAYLKSLPLTMKPVGALSDEALCALIEKDALHVLIDLSGHTRGNRLYALANKPAPVMAHWLGYMFTSGLPAMDYRITDPWTDPPEMAPQQHTEQLAYLERSQFIYQPKDQLPEVNELPALRNGYVTFGSLNNIQKLNRSVVEVGWAADGGAGKQTVAADEITGGLWGNWSDSWIVPSIWGGGTAD